MFGKKSNAEFIVDGMTCQHCENRVSKALTDTKGVRKVNIDLDSGKVVVEYREKHLDINHLSKVIQDAGYKVQSSKQVDA